MAHERQANGLLEAVRLLIELYSAVSAAVIQGLEEWKEPDKRGTDGGNGVPRDAHAATDVAHACPPSTSPGSWSEWLLPLLLVTGYPEAS